MRRIPPDGSGRRRNSSFFTNIAEESSGCVRQGAGLCRALYRRRRHSATQDHYGASLRLRGDVLVVDEGFAVFIAIIIYQYRMRGDVQSTAPGSARETTASACPRCWKSPAANVNLAQFRTNTAARAATASAIGAGPEPRERSSATTRTRASLPNPFCRTSSRGRPDSARSLRDPTTRSQD